MVFNPTQIKYVINQQKKIISTTLDQIIVVTSMPLKRITFWHFTTGRFSVKDSGAEYDTTSATEFDHEWVDSVIDE